MKKHLFFVVSFFAGTFVYAANDRAFVWQVSSAHDPLNKTTVYLMGSVHFADKSFYPLRKEIEEAFSRSNTLVVELDINKIDSRAYQQLIAQKGSYKDGATIKDFISEQTWLQLRQRLRHLNIPYDSVKNYKPGMLVMTLTAVQIMQMGFDPQLGIDAHFLAKASLQGQLKDVVELESMEQQINLFLNIANGELLLKESLYSQDEAVLLVAEMMRFWKQGDETGMNKLLFEDALSQYPAFSTIYDSLFYKRNRNMVQKIEAMLTGEYQHKLQGKLQNAESYFVVVGSGHLIGEKGIVNALEEKGYEVKRF